ncbi:VOC family protein [Tsukamurella sp. TY48]|nr:VOC family protein [Tsukamurella sp. TY48]
MDDVHSARLLVGSGAGVNVREQLGELFELVGGQAHNRAMTVRLNPYISFADNAREALEFYREVLGGELEISTFEGMPPEMIDPSETGKVMHGQLTTPDGLTLMAADTPAGMPRTVGDDISVSLSGDDLAKLTGWWEKLSGSGQVTVPFVQAPWGDTFGMCVDRFGVKWLVNASAS